MAMAKGGGTRHGNGAGWGGPAKGAGSAADKAPPFEPGNQAAVGNGAAHTFARSVRKQVQDALDSNAVRGVMILVEIANNANEPTMARVNAAKALVEHVKGTPIATNLHVNTDDVRQLNDEQLDSHIAELLGKAGTAGRLN